MEYRTKYRRQERKDTALSLAKECYSMKMDLLTSATLVDDAIRFVSRTFKDKENLKSLANNDDSEYNNEESNEPDHDKDEDQLEEEQKEETNEITTNQVF